MRRSHQKKDPSEKTETLISKNILLYKFFHKKEEKNDV